MNALDYIRLMVTAKRNFYFSIPTDEANRVGRVYDDVVGIIDEIEEVLVHVGPPLMVADEKET